MEIPNIYFPHLGLSFHISSEAFTIFNITIYWYGIIITAGFVLGTLLASYIAKKEGVNQDVITDFVLYDILFAILGARIYFVAFRWQEYKGNLGDIFNIRQGGLAIYGGIIASVIVALIYTRIRKVQIFKFADILTYGLILGQAIGRYGNFTNKEAFGGNANNLFSMAILYEEAKPATTGGLLNIVQFPQFGMAQYIQVHPTFFYESTWNFALLILLLFYRKHKKCEGEIFFLYLIGYGIGRFWIEGLRTDQLLLPYIQVPASQCIAILSAIMGIIGIIMCRNNVRNK